MPESFLYITTSAFLSSPTIFIAMLRNYFIVRHAERDLYLRRHFPKFTVHSRPILETKLTTLNDFS